jgi:hypothetical protein
MKVCHCAMLWSQQNVRARVLWPTQVHGVLLTPSLCVLVPETLWMCCSPRSFVFAWHIKFRLHSRAHSINRCVLHDMIMTYALRMQLSVN